MLLVIHPTARVAVPVGVLHHPPARLSVHHPVALVHVRAHAVEAAADGLATSAVTLGVEPLALVSLAQVVEEHPEPLASAVDVRAVVLHAVSAVLVLPVRPETVTLVVEPFALVLITVNVRHRTSTCGSRSGGRVSAIANFAPRRGGGNVARGGGVRHAPFILLLDHSPLYFLPDGRNIVGRSPSLSAGSRGLDQACPAVSRSEASLAIVRGDA